MKYKAEIEEYRVGGRPWQLEGALLVSYKSNRMAVIFSIDQGWDHVSVSLTNRCPNWEEMCFIKDLFFDEEETVIQFHPKKSRYVNIHPFCLHMWRKKASREMELPPNL